ncbi:hypothetical protein KC19_3G045100 [Ceratodon purpureus]|uniref:Glycosyltransferase n=1 Tax=Ceratodon purpureus TaxID=3225 RepID=A0A8T0IHE4_CERPU|nr:hypothetical protein KC19_3G045100 [Ceratodon purpureus]
MFGSMADSVHVVLMPYPSVGHSAPFVHFAKHLARSGVAVSFIAPDAELAIFNDLLLGDAAFEARQNINVVPFAFPIHQEEMDPAYFFSIRDWMQSNADKFHEILARLMSEEPRTVCYPGDAAAGFPVCIISDMFLGFTQELADKLSIPRYCLYSSPAHFLSFTFHMPQFDSEGRLPATSWEDKPFLIPNFPSILPAHLPPFQLTVSNAVNSFFVEESKPLWRAAGVIVNTVYELESPVIDGLRAYLAENSPNKEVPTIVTMGPVMGELWEGGSTSTFRERLNATPKREACFDWLDQQAESSVLYICFGSIVMPSDAQVHELAVGLESSMQPFLWVLRILEAGKTLSQVLPEGFLERTKSRGFVYTSWAPQLHILAHRAVGGFLSHCGWNSAVEGMIMGVPMIAMPVMGDQMLNATLIVKVLGVGIRVNEIGVWYETVGKEIIEKAVRTLMTGADGEAMRRKAAQVSVTIQKSVRPGGSSYENLALFLRHLKSLKSTGLQR